MSAIYANESVRREDLELYEIDCDGIHYRVPSTREGIASLVREIRKAVRS